MKKNFLILATLAVIAFGFSSCAAWGDSVGALYMGHTKPYAVTSSQIGTKVGTVKTTNVFSLVVLGDASVNKAAKMAGITHVSHVDVKTTSILSLFCVKTYYVYGE